MPRFDVPTKPKHVKVSGFGINVSGKSHQNVYCVISKLKAIGYYVYYMELHTIHAYTKNISLVHMLIYDYART